MHTFEIIKKAFYLPFRAYKGFALTTLLFFISEIVQEMLNQAPVNDMTVIMSTLVLIMQIVILGISIAVVYHYIYDSFDIREVSLTATAKAGLKDSLIETYYYSLTLIFTVVITYSLGIYHDIYSIIGSIIYVDAKFQTFTLPQLLKYLSPEAYHHLAVSVIATLAIFVIIFAIAFSYCSFAKIRLKETGSMKESVNFVKLSHIIKSKGIRKYLNFVVLNFIVFMVVLMLMRTLEAYLIAGSIISAMAEAFALFFILDSYCLFYYS